MKNLYTLVTFFIFSIALGQNPGDLDTSFQVGNINSSMGVGTIRTKVASNGKIYAIGIAAPQNLTVDKLVRFNSNGSIDLTFNKGTGFPYYFTTINTIEIQNDGKIIVGGKFNSYNNFTSNDLVRLNPDGSFDSSFNVGAGFDAGYYATNGEVFDVKVLDNGKIICVGDFSTFNGVAVNHIVRLNSDGSLDTSFVNVDTGSPYLTRILVDPVTNKTYIAGKVNDLFRGLVRLNYDGSVDNTFNVLNGFNGMVSGMALQVNDKIVAVGDFTTYKNVQEKRIIRLNNDGSKDTSFNIGDGIDNLSVITTPVFLSDVLIKPDGKIVVCGSFSKYNNEIRYNIVQLFNDGTMDNSFDTYYAYNASYLTDLDLQSDNKIIVGGTCEFNANIQYPNVTRLSGRDYYLVRGENTFDYNINGCDVNDTKLYFLKFNVTSPTNSSVVFSSYHGTNNFYLKNGVHTITPSIDYLNYFNFSPSSINVNFPTQVSPLTQNFCIKPNGVHPDLEVILVPFMAASPGFDANYVLVCRNKGNQLMSGTVTLNYDDNVLDFVSALPVSSTSATGVRTWDFVNLSPFEIKEIALKLNLNSPVETPPLNSGSVLNYTAIITSTQTDETPNDNTFVLNQTVVNSYDPNDKICLQGTTVGLDKVGEYVHYVIRFENTGTYAAKNITVKDIIDTDKFDINTLMPLNGSHLFTTKISNGNKVEFYFENINLPFADATNDGYLAFKIKTKSTLVAGDTFGGLANIFFDYNSAITTNTYTTTIQALSVKDFSFENYFSLYPNPVSDILNIDKKDDIEISSIQIYNVMGQLMMVVPNAKNVSTLDVSNLSSGNYFVKINSDKGTSNTKFIKR